MSAEETALYDIDDLIMELNSILNVIIEYETSRIAEVCSREKEQIKDEREAVFKIAKCKLSLINTLILRDKKVIELVQAWKLYTVLRLIRGLLANISDHLDVMIRRLDEIKFLLARRG